MEFYQVDNPKDKLKVLAYGPEYTKILATYDSITTGILAATNGMHNSFYCLLLYETDNLSADSLAQFCLARYVQRIGFNKL